MERCFLSFGFLCQPAEKRYYLNLNHLSPLPCVGKPALLVDKYLILVLSNRFVIDQCIPSKSLCCSKPWNIPLELTHYFTKRLYAVSMFCQHISRDVNKAKAKETDNASNVIKTEILQQTSKASVCLPGRLFLVRNGRNPQLLHLKPQRRLTSLWEKTSIWQPCLVANITTKLFHDLTTKCIHIADTGAISLCLRDGKWISWGINHVECLPEEWYSASI